MLSVEDWARDDSAGRAGPAAQLATRRDRTRRSNTPVWGSQLDSSTDVLVSWGLSSRLGHVSGMCGHPGFGVADDWQPPRLTRRSSRWRSLEAMARGIGRPGWRRRHRAAAAISEIMDVLAGLLDRVKAGQHEKAI